MKEEDNNEEPVMSYDSHNRNSFQKLIIILLGISVVVNIIRFEVKGIDLSGFMRDFKLVYVASDVFSKGENPYRRTNLQIAWQNVPDKEKLIDGSTLPVGPFMYPPFTILFFLPVALIPWKVAAYLMLGLNFVLVAGIIGLLGYLGNFLNSKYDVLLCILLFAALKVVHHGLVVGQPFFISFFFGLSSLYFVKQERKILALVTFVIAFIKPTIAIPFFLYFFFKKKYRFCIYVFCLVLFFNMIVVFIMPMNSIPTYFQEVSLSFKLGHINDYTPLNPLFCGITGIQTLLYLGINSEIVISIIKYTIAGLLIAFFLIKRKKFSNVPYNIIVFFTFMSLFFIYHRFVDTLALTVVLITMNPSQLFKSLHWRAFLLVPFLYPVTGLVIRLKHLLPPFIYHFAALNIQLSIVILFVCYMFALNKIKHARID